MSILPIQKIHLGYIGFIDYIQLLRFEFSAFFRLLFALSKSAANSNTHFLHFCALLANLKIGILMHLKSGKCFHKRHLPKKANEM